MIRSNKILRTVLALGLMLCLAAALLPGAALADELVPQEGSITLSMSETDFRQDLLAADAKFDVDIYYVATVSAGGSYTAVDEFSAVAEDVAALGVGSDMRALTDKVWDIIFPENGEMDENGEPIPAVTPRTEPELPVVGGKITFPADKLGLYLIAPHTAESEEYVYTFSPILLSVPALGTDYDAEHGRWPAEDGEGGETEQSQQEHLPWQYDYNVFLKAQRKDLTGRIVIEKSLLTYNQSLGEVKFVFDVTARDADGNIVFSDVITLEFDGPITKSVTVTGIPVGTDVTVTEIYSGGSYRVVPDPDNQGQYRIVPESKEGPNGPPVASFINDYDDTIIPSIGIVNHFENTGNGMWEWHPIQDNS